jgi:2-polyprenyl-3-methyl-5-hydroxy-6-metoxy-1,4-benzoquinol methylase
MQNHPTKETDFNTVECFDPVYNDEQRRRGGCGGGAASISSQDEYYFDSYAQLQIHEEMLRDKARVNAYSRAILNNKRLFKGKVVMDVGAGTGLLSLLSAQAGAKKVYAVECAGDVAKLLREVVKKN